MSCDGVAWPQTYLEIFNWQNLNPTIKVVSWFLQPRFRASLITGINKTKTQIACTTWPFFFFLNSSTLYDFPQKIEFCNYPFENLLNVQSFVVFVVLEKKENVGVWWEILLGKKKGRLWESEWDSCCVCMDVKWGKAFDEICRSILFSWMEFTHLPFSIS